MVKWKKMNKKMAGLLLGVMMLFTASTTAFAYVDESAEASKVETTQTEQSTDKEEKKDEATNTNEVLPEDGTDKGTAFTTPGNGEVKDDITDDSTKEFLTVTTKNIVCLATMLLATAFTTGLTIENAALAALNAVLATFTAMGEYEITFAKLNK